MNTLTAFLLLALFATLAACATSSVSDLFISRQHIQIQLNNIQKQLSDVRNTKVSLIGMREATSLLVSNAISVNGYTSTDIQGLNDEAGEQFKDLEKHEKGLEMRVAVLQRSLEIINANIASSGYNALLKRFSSNFYGTSFFTPNGTLFFVGKVDANLLHGSTAYPASDYVAKSPLKIDLTPISGDQITQLHAIKDAFYAMTLKGDIYHWGASSEMGITAGTGYIGNSAVLRKVDFGLISKPVVAKKMICDQTTNVQGTLNNCWMLTTDGELYFWGVWYLFWHNYYGFMVAKPDVFGTSNINKARQFKIIINGVEKFASDFTVTQGTCVTNSGSATKPSQTICVIDRDDQSNIYCALDNTFGTFGDGTTVSTTVSGITFDAGQSTWVTSKKEASANGEVFTQLFGASKTMYAVGASGKLYSWGITSALLGRNILVESNLKIAKVSFAETFKVSRICSGPNLNMVLLVNTNNNVYILGNYNGIDYDVPYLFDGFRGKTFVDCEVTDNVQHVLFTNGQTYSKVVQGLHQTCVVGQEYVGMDKMATLVVLKKKIDSELNKVRVNKQNLIAFRQAQEMIIPYLENFDLKQDKFQELADSSQQELLYLLKQEETLSMKSTILSSSISILNGRESQSSNIVDKTRKCVCFDLNTGDKCEIEKTLLFANAIEEVTLSDSNLVVKNLSSIFDYTPKTCKEYLSHYYSGKTGSGFYLIKPTNSYKAFPVYCDMEKGGWVYLNGITSVGEGPSKQPITPISPDIVDSIEFRSLIKVSQEVKSMIGDICAISDESLVENYYDRVMKLLCTRNGFENSIQKHFSFLQFWIR